VQALRDQLRETADLVRRVLAQTRARVLKGDTHSPDKVLSIFEPETEAIRKGKAAKPTEFGKLVKIQEAEAGLITDYTVCPTRVPDQELWVPAQLWVPALAHRRDKRCDLGSLAARCGWAECGLPCGSPA
jgi:IS5 family transposase